MSTMQTAMKMALIRTMPLCLAPNGAAPGRTRRPRPDDSHSGSSSVHKRRGAASPLAAMAKLLLCFYNGRQGLQESTAADAAFGTGAKAHVGNAANDACAPAGVRDRLHRLDRGGAAGGVRRVPHPAFRGLDRSADLALRQPAARPDRGANLWPRVAARLRQAAAAAVVAR